MPTATPPKRLAKPDRFTTVRLRDDSRKSIVKFCVGYGVKTWRAIEVLLAAWDKLTPEQQAECLHNR